MGTTLVVSGCTLSGRLSGLVLSAVAASVLLLVLGSLPVGMGLGIAFIVAWGIAATTLLARAIRLSAAASPGHLTVRNLFRTVTVSWESIERVYFRHGLSNMAVPRVVCSDGRAVTILAFTGGHGPSDAAVDWVNRVHDALEPSGAMSAALQQVLEAE